MSSVGLANIPNQNILLIGALSGYHTYGINKYVFVVMGILVLAFIINLLLMIYNIKKNINTTPTTSIDNTTTSNEIPSIYSSNKTSTIMPNKIQLIIQVVLFILIFIFGMYFNFKRVEYINKLIIPRLS
jgi:hypothetical protein